jgi:hypothetical protein
MKQLLIILLATVAAPTIASSQNIGVGTSTPTEKLHIAGNLKADTVKPNVIKLTPNAGNGKVLTSDASGNASWQNLAGGNANGNVGYGPWGDCSMSGITEYLPVADDAGKQYEYLGEAVALQGNFAVVGRHRATINGNSMQGEAEVFEHNGTTWVYKQTLSDPSGLASDQFGSSVAISATYMAIGAPNAKINGMSNRGAVYIYKYFGGSWVFYQKITDATGAADDYFGNTVSITESFLAVGVPADHLAPGYNQGSVCMFRHNGSSWVSQAKLLDPTPATQEYFGTSVSVYDNRVVIGCPLDDVAGDYNEGSASIFEYNGTSWIFKQKIDGIAGFQGQDFKFGYSVSMSGDYILVGAPEEDVYLQYEKQGSAWFFHYDGSSWVFSAKVYNEKEQPGDEFGYSVSLSGNYALVGTRYDDIKHYEGGSANIYKRVGSGWGDLQYVTDKMGSSWSEFGTAVGIDGTTNRFIIGAPGYAEGAGKVVFGKVF